jgi:hypothetical protein
MKTKLSKAMRVSAVVAALLASHQCGWAFDNVDDLLEHLQNHIITQTYITGPWTSTANPTYDSTRDYGSGVGEIVGENADKLVFNNFYLPGLNIDAKITEESGKFYFNLDISKVYQLKTGYTSNYTPKYEGKYAKIYTLYKSPTESSWSNPTEIGTTTNDDGTIYAYIRASEESADTYSFPFDTNGDCKDLRSNASHKGLIIAIYNDKNCEDLFDVKAFTQGSIQSNYAANATAEDYDEDGNLMRSYKMNYAIEANAYKLFNLNGYGLQFSAYSAYGTQPVTTTCSWLEKEVYFNGKETCISAINNSTSFKFEGYKDLDNSGVSKYWFSYDAANRTTLTLASEATNYYHKGTYQQTEATNLETFGFYGADTKEIDHNHATTDCPWVTNDGDRKTGSADAEFYFDNYGLVYWTNSNGTIPTYSLTKGELTYHEKYSLTKIYGLAVNDDYKKDYNIDTFDCTLDVALSIDQFGSNADNIYVSGTITPNANTDFVDHYELCVKPGTSKTVTNFADGYKSDANGFVGSTNISSSSYDFSYDAESNSANNVRSFRVESSDADSEEASESISFSKLIPKSALTSKGTSNDDYSFYVKAVYKSEYINEDNATDPGLNPTFHDIQSSGITTGIESVVEGGSDVAIYGVDGTIEVFGEVSSVDVYSISGAQVYSGSEKTIAVPAGLYIVKAGKAVAKVVVK